MILSQNSNNPKGTAGQWLRPRSRAAEGRVVALWLLDLTSDFLSQVQCLLGNGHNNGMDALYPPSWYSRGRMG